MLRSGNPDVSVSLMLGVWFAARSRRDRVGLREMP